MFLNIYNRKGMNTIREKIREMLEQNLDKRCIIMGDWNAKLGDLGERTEWDLRKESGGRNTKDEVVNEEGKSKPVIDYGAVNEMAWSEIIEFRVRSNILSDHFPLETTLSSSRSVCCSASPELVYRYELNEKNMEQYKHDLQAARETTGCEWKEIAQAMGAAAPKRQRPSERKDPQWWNAECYRARLNVKKERNLARKTNDFTYYKETRKQYKLSVGTAKLDLRQKQTEELRNIKDINGAWRYINNYKKKVSLVLGRIQASLRNTSGACWEQMKKWKWKHRNRRIHTPKRFL